jgi:hypothetical protein
VRGTGAALVSRAACFDSYWEPCGGVLPLRLCRRAGRLPLLIACNPRRAHAVGLLPPSPRPTPPCRLGWLWGAPAAQIALQAISLSVLTGWRAARDRWLVRHAPERATWAGASLEALRGLPTYTAFAVPVGGRQRGGRTAYPAA